jgi:orotidine-5'-phosphate decarboxylase
MTNFADRLIEAITEKGNPCIIGLDPRLELVPKIFFADSEDKTQNEIVEDVLFDFNSCIIDEIKGLVPAVKLQSAFYEQYGVPGIWAMKRSIRYAKQAGLIVVVDAKRNDIGSTAEAYANAYIGKTKIFEGDEAAFGADAMTVSPFLGADSLAPFVEAAKKYGTGIFVLVKNSNPGSGDFQDLTTADGEKVYTKIARMVDTLGQDLVGESGYSSIGAVVGATYPEEAAALRKIMPQALFLVPGYGAQGGTAHDTLPAFNEDKRGAIVHSARNIIFGQINQNVSREEYGHSVRENTEKMIADITGALK